MITVSGMLALRRLRMELQEKAGDRFPEALCTELLVLHDACRYLDLTIFQARDILGEVGWRYVTDYINGPACDSVNWKRVRERVS